MLYKLADKVTYEEASLVEPLSVVLHGVRRAKPQPGGKYALMLQCVCSFTLHRNRFGARSRGCRSSRVLNG